MLPSTKGVKYKQSNGSEKLGLCHAMTGQVEEDCQMGDKAMPSRLGKTTAGSTVRK